ncbi:MAG TPA: S8 family serine peptidase [Clostridia bacterium]
MLNKFISAKKITSIVVTMAFAITAFSSKGFALETAKAVNEPDFATDSVIVVMSDTNGEEVTKKVQTVFSDVGIESVTNLDSFESATKDKRRRHIKFKLKNKSKSEVLKAVEKLKSKPGVLIAEPNYVMSKCTTTPNDELYYAQSNMKLISADKAWDLTTGSPNITVGIVDTGVYIDNKDLLPNMWTNSKEIPNNRIDDDGNGYVDDYFGYNFDDESSDCFDDDGHGTLCAGLVAAKGNNSIQVAGVSWQTKIASLRIVGASHHQALAGDMIEAVNYASKMGIQILNISMGTYAYSQALYDAINAYPGLVVTAAGNYMSNNDSSPFYPASFDLDNIISVGNTDGNDKLAPDSNYGKTSVDLTAPGEKIIWSTGLGSNTYDSGAGTSMSAPQVAGAAALIMAYRPSYSVQDVKKAILNNVDVVSGLSGLVATSGRLNVYKALMADVAAPTATGFTLYGLSDTGSTSTIPVNHEGELWTKTPKVRAVLSGVTDDTGVQGVKFYVSDYYYPNSGSSRIVDGQRSGVTNNWYVDVPVSGNSMTIQAFPVDVNGNTLLDTKKGDTSYQYTKYFGSDTTSPSGYTYIEPQGNYYIDVNNRYVTNAAQIKLRINVNDSDGAPWISSSVKNVSVRLYKNGSTSFTSYTAQYVSGYQNRSGDYVVTFNKPNVTGEIPYRVSAIITDYAGNSFTTEDKYFVVDTQSPRGTVITPSSTVVGDSFDVYLDNVTDAVNVDKIYFPTWTDANGQDDIIWYEGYRVGEKTWKITINRSNHKNEKGLYYVHVYSQDILGNFGIVGATSVTLQ